MKRLFHRVCIIGVGLIGGSLAKSIKRSGMADEVVGYFRKESSAEFARKNRILDKYYLNMESALKDSDLIILAAPVYKIIDIAKKIKDLVPAQALIMDVGSTKREIVSRLSKIYPGRYLGTHPLAGSEKRGLDFSSPDIFSGKIVVLTPDKNTFTSTVKKLKLFWERTGADVIEIKAELHDKILSMVSHMPHLIAYALVGITDKYYLNFASSGFKDSTRIAASDPEIWSEIFVSNRKNITGNIDEFIKMLLKYKSLISKSDVSGLAALVKEASCKRKVLK